MNSVEYVPIKLDSAFKPTELTKVSLSRYAANGQKYKVEAPQFSGNHGEHNKEALLYVVREFQGTILDELHLNLEDEDPDIIKEQFYTFRRMLTEQARAYFNEIFQVYLDDLDLQGCLIAFMEMSGYLNESDRNYQLNYNSKVKKPFKFSVAQFHNRLMVLFAYAAMMPGEMDADGQPMIDPRVNPTDMAIKNIIYNAMPETWKGDFVRSNQKITNISLASLVSYMDAVRQSHDSSKAQSEKDKKNNGNGQGNGNGKDSDGKKRKFHKNNSTKSSNQGSNKQTRTAQPEDHCPIHPHGKHKYKDCYILLDAKKHRASQGSNSNTNNTGTKNNNNRSHHHTQRSAGSNDEQKEEVMETHHTARVGWQVPSDGEDDE